MRYDNDSLFIARSEGTRIINTGIRVGARIPLYASATGHVLLASLDPTELADYLAATPFPVRAAGMAINSEGLEIRLSISVPVHDPD